MGGTPTLPLWKFPKLKSGETLDKFRVEQKRKHWRGLSVTLLAGWMDNNPPHNMLTP